MRIGDLVIETCTWESRPPKAQEALGIILPLPDRMMGTPLEQEFNNGTIVWVRWPKYNQSNWSFVKELEVKSENR